ncbi:DUF2061 domain-containing protein [Laribacter hongkongensis]|jgi:uncharacterized membrane protein|uniref:DUF2061 domain-containing protein n=1 Tax=Laribacter hongkongensis TaxID=168471 RepID=UPI0035710F6A
MAIINSLPATSDRPEPIMHLDHLPAGTPLLKTLTFAVVHFSVAFSVAYLLTGSLGIASLLAMVEPLCNTVAYFFHEKLWGHLGRRRMPAGLADAPQGVQP